MTCAELIAENLRKLVSLDLSWCPRVTDAALEYIACDLTHLEELTLDRSIVILYVAFSEKNVLRMGASKLFNRTGNQDLIGNNYLSVED